MTQAYFLKNLPAPLQFWVRPMLLASLGLHGLVLAIPTPPEKKPEPPKKESERVKITQLPTTTITSAPKTAPKPSPAISQVKASPVAPPPRSQTQPINQPSIIAPVPQARSMPQPQLTLTPTPTPQSTARPVPQPQSTATPTAQQSPVPQPQSTPTPTAQQSPVPQPQPQATPAPTPSSTPQDPFLTGFPTYPGVQPGTEGLLAGDLDKSGLHTSATFADVASWYQTNLKDYNPQIVGDDSKLKVYQVSKNNVSKYLNVIFSDKSGNTVILLADQKIDPQTLAANATQEDPLDTRYQGIMAQVDNDELFLSGIFPNEEPELRSQIDGLSAAQVQKEHGIAKKTIPGMAETTPVAVGAYLQGKLKGQGFSAEFKGNFGSGLVYTVSSSSFTRYLVLLPSPKGTGTAIVTTKNSPN
jgi:hypothetical protein